MKKNNRFSRRSFIIFLISFFIFFFSCTISNQLLNLFGHKNLVLTKEEEKILLVDTLDPTIGRIVFSNHQGIDINLLETLLVENLKELYDSTKQANVVDINFTEIDSLPSKVYQYVGKTTAVSIKIRENFNPRDKRYKKQTPTEGATFIFNIFYVHISEEEIASLISKALRHYLPRVYDRSLYFQQEEKPPKEKRKRISDKYASKSPDRYYLVRTLYLSTVLLSITVSTYPHTGQCHG